MMQSNKRPRVRRRGAIIVLVAFMTVAVFCMLALSVDTAFVQLCQTELKKGLDVSAHAGSEALARTQDMDAARLAVQAIAQQHTVGGTPLSIPDESIQFGRAQYSETGSWAFVPNTTTPNSVRVLGAPAEGISSFFGRMFGVSKYNLSDQSTSAHITRDICFVLDRSGSMAWDMSGVEDSYPEGCDYCTPPHATLSRWSGLKEAVSAFLVELGNTKQIEYVSAVTYSTEYTECDVSVNAADLNQTLTSNYSAINTLLDNLSANPIPGGTNISAGIDMAVPAVTDPDLSRTFSDKMIVLLTDGQENAGRSSLLAAADAATANVVIHTITFSDGASEEEMAAVAAATGGQHFHAPDAAALTAIFEKIARGLPVVLIE